MSDKSEQGKIRKSIISGMKKRKYLGELGSF